MLLAGEESVEAAAARLREAGAGTVVIKCGARGCYLDRCSREVLGPGREKRKVRRHHRSGRQFRGWFPVCAFPGEGPLRECAEYGNRCGAKAVSVAGATDWVEKIAYSI